MHPSKGCDMTYAPVASWESVSILLSQVLRHKWKTKQLDYVQAFPQAPVEHDCCMRYQMASSFMHTCSGYWEWNATSTGRDKLVGRWDLSRANTTKRAFFHGREIYVLCTDDSILAGPDEVELNVFIVRIKESASTSQKRARPGRLPWHQHRAYERPFISPLPPPPH
jgi:hypothetical protein